MINTQTCTTPTKYFPQVGIINADLEGSTYLYNVRKERRNFQATTSKLKERQYDEQADKPLKLVEQHERAGDESDEIKIDDTEHMKIQNKMVAAFEFLGLFFGLDVKYGYAMHRQVLFYVTSFFLIFGLCDIAYTATDKYLNGGHLEFLEPLGIFGTIFTLSSKWVNTFHHINNTICLVVYPPRNLIEGNKTGVTADIIIANLKRTSRIVDIYTVGVLTVLCFYLIIPLKYFFVNNEYMLILPINIPFCDESTLAGYLMACGVQTVFGAYTGLATIMFGSGILISISNYGILVDLVHQDIKTLDYMWKHPGETSAAHRLAFLKNICNKVQDMRSYIRQVKVIYEYNLFIYFFMAYSGQVLCIFAIMKNNWIPGYTTAGVIFVEMMFYCFVGTKLNTMDEQLIEIIYCDCKWYTFDLKSQKICQLLLHASQVSSDLQLGPIGKLNMATGIVKSIYTYYTVLSEAL